VSRNEKKQAHRRFLVRQFSGASQRCQSMAKCEPRNTWRALQYLREPMV